MNRYLNGLPLVFAWVGCTQVGVCEERGKFTPPDAAPVIVNESGGLIAELSTEQKTGTLKTRFPIPNDDHLLLVNLSGPFDSGSSTAVVGDLDGLAGSATAELGYLFVDNNRHQLSAFSARAGTKSFKYADPAEIGKDITSTKNGYDISVGWSQFFEEGQPLSAKRGAVFGVRFRYQRVYKATEDYQLCTDDPDSAALICRTTGRAAPGRTDAMIAQVQYAFLPRDNVGLALAVSHDFRGGTTGIELPIYLARDDKTGLLNGGLKLSWQSDTDDTSAILFVGIPIGTL